jgi:hypothetical protein
MGPDERELIFGEPSELLAAEAVWIYREEHGSWPLWHQAVDSLAAFPSVDSRKEAEERLSQAVCQDEVFPRLRERGRGHSFVLEVTEEKADGFARRQIALQATPLPDEEAPC